MSETDGNIEQFPRKEFYSIGEVAKHLGVEAYTIRYWQKEFNLKIPTKPNGRRVFTVEVIHVLEKIKRLRYQDKLQIDGVKHQLRQEQNNPVVGKQEVPQIIYPEPDPPDATQEKSSVPPVQKTESPIPQEDIPNDMASLLQQKRQDREQKYIVDELKKIRDILTDDSGQ